MKTPEIIIDGKTCIAQKPKAKVFRDALRYDEIDRKTMDINQCIDREAEIVAALYGDNITADGILENYEIDQIRELYASAIIWMLGIWSGRLAEIPNAENPTA